MSYLKRKTSPSGESTSARRPNSLSVNVTQPKMSLVFGGMAHKTSAFVVCAMFTESYKEKALRLAQSLDILNMSHALYEIPHVHSSTSPKGSNNADYAKANFILHVLEKTQRPVLYIDADCVVLKPLDLIKKISAESYDFAIFNWLSSERNDAYLPYPVDLEGSEFKRYYGFSHQIDVTSGTQLICSGAVQFWGQTAAAKHLLRTWLDTVQRNPFSEDDKSLDFAFNNKSILHAALKPFWLPKSHVRYPFWIFDEPTISHPDFPFVGTDWEEISDSAGRQRLYSENGTRKTHSLYLPPGSFLDTQTGDILNQAGSGFANAGKISMKYWL